MQKTLNYIFNLVLGGQYKPREFYYLLMEAEDTKVQAISRAMDAGTNQDIRTAICEYVNSSNLEDTWKEVICNNVNVMNWI